MKAIQIIDGLARKRGISLVGGLLLGLAACSAGCAAHAPAPEVENVGQLAPSYNSIATAPVHHDEPPTMGIVVSTDADEAQPSVSTADAGTDDAAPEVTAKAGGLLMGAAR